MKKMNLLGTTLAVTFALSQNALALDYQTAISPKTQKSVDIATDFYADALNRRALGYHLNRT